MSSYCCSSLHCCTEQPIRGQPKHIHENVYTDLSVSVTVRRDKCGSLQQPRWQILRIYHSATNLNRFCDDLV